MYPAGIFMLQAFDGVVWLEDRANIAFAPPNCLAPSLSTLISSSVSASGDVINATFSRPIELNSTWYAAGYLDVTDGSTFLLGAMLQGTAPAAATRCLPLSQHDNAGNAPVTLLPTPAAGQLCIEPECFSTLGWSFSNGNVAFAATCSTPGVPISWCGFGLSPTGAMVPSEAWVLQADPSGTGAVYLEDRNLTVYGSPPCYPTQASTLVYSYASPSGDTISATWTRPVTLPPSLIAQGYLNIASGPMTIIAAMVSGAGSVPTPPFQSCRALNKHNINGALAVNITVGTSS